MKGHTRIDRRFALLALMLAACLVGDVTCRPTGAGAYSGYNIAQSTADNYRDQLNTHQNTFESIKDNSGYFGHGKKSFAQANDEMKHVSELLRKQSAALEAAKEQNYEKLKDLGNEVAGYVAEKVMGKATDMLSEVDNWKKMADKLPDGSSAKQAIEKFLKENGDALQEGIDKLGKAGEQKENYQNLSEITEKYNEMLENVNKYGAAVGGTDAVAKEIRDYAVAALENSPFKGLGKVLEYGSQLAEWAGPTAEIYWQNQNIEDFEKQLELNNQHFMNQYKDVAGYEQAVNKYAQVCENMAKEYERRLAEGSLSPEEKAKWEQNLSDARQKLAELSDDFAAAGKTTPEDALGALNDTLDGAGQDEDQEDTYAEGDDPGEDAGLDPDKDPDSESFDDATGDGSSGGGGSGPCPPGQHLSCDPNDPTNCSCI